jgi:hypothetical protein
MQGCAILKSGEYGCPLWVKSGRPYYIDIVSIHVRNADAGCINRLRGPQSEYPGEEFSYLFSRHAASEADLIAFFDGAPEMTKMRTFASLLT